MIEWIKTSKKIWLWIGGLTTMVIAGLAVEYTKEYPIPGMIWNSIIYLYDRFIIAMTVNLKLWWVLILAIIILIISYLLNDIEIIKTGKETSKQSNIIQQQPKFLLYKKERVDGILWEWDWEFINGRWTVQNLQPYCPKDGGRLMQFSNDCPICNTNYFGVANGDKAAAIIELKIKELIQNNP